jgi:hypothetical protein
VYCRMHNALSFLKRGTLPNKTCFCLPFVFLHLDKRIMVHILHTYSSLVFLFNMHSQNSCPVDSINIPIHTGTYIYVCRYVTGVHAVFTNVADSQRRQEIFLTCDVVILLWPNGSGQTNLLFSIVMYKDL